MSRDDLVQKAEYARNAQAIAKAVLRQTDKLGDKRWPASRIFGFDVAKAANEVATASSAEQAKRLLDILKHRAEPIYNVNKELVKRIVQQGAAAVPRAEAAAASSATLQEAVIQLRAQALEEQRLLRAKLSEVHQAMQTKEKLLEDHIRTARVKEQELELQTQQYLASKKQLADCLEVQKRLQQQAWPAAVTAAAASLDCAASDPDVLYLEDLLQRIQAAQGELGSRHSWRNKISSASLDAAVDALDHLRVARMRKQFCEMKEYATAARRALFEELARQLADLKEEVLGAVRAYVSVRAGGGSRNSLLRADTERMTVAAPRDCGKPPVQEGQEQVFGPFERVFQAASNQHIFSSTDAMGASIQSMMRQALPGHSIVLFGYGASGAGKTYTLLGSASQGQPGLLQLALDDLQQQGASVQLRHVFELYMGEVNITTGTMRDKLHVLYSPPEVDRSGRVFGVLPEHTEVERIKDLESRVQAVNGQKVPLGTSLPALMAAIDKHRTEQQRIKPTVLNSASSRSHLFAVFEVLGQRGGPKGYVTVVDMAGRESVQDLLQAYLPAAQRGQKDGGDQLLVSAMQPYVAKSGLLNKGIQPEQARLLPVLLKESVYITESLDHLVYYLQHKRSTGQGRPAVAPPKKKGWRRKLPQPEEAMELARQPHGANLCLMVPVLTFLDQNLSRGSRTKFAMLCMVQDQTACSINRATLEFADSVKRTV